MRVQVVDIKLYDRIISFLSDASQLTYGSDYTEPIAERASQLLDRLQQRAGEDHGTEIVLAGRK